MTATDQHNAAILPLLRQIVRAARTEADQWTLLETLCLGIGRLHGRTAKETAVYIETMAERLATGERGE